MLRLVATFVTDKWNRAVLGTFLGIFMYCLLVQRSISSPDDDASPFIPQISIFVAMIFAVGGLPVRVLHPPRCSQHTGQQYRRSHRRPNRQSN